ncbi:MAG TPA: hypothetical protein VGO52_02430 [Hyphomonadaceae bacterium]|jgi:hypothetical protein|nr:hypothetical protein [Hyphomonadaceae bacterium]
MKFLGAPAIAAIFLAACASAPAEQPFDLAKPEAFVPGVTTKAEAIASLGQPTSRMGGPEGASTIFYEFNVTPTEANGNVSRVSLMLLFDPMDKFVSKRNLGFGK